MILDRINNGKIEDKYKLKLRKQEILLAEPLPLLKND
jgi:hypothetical protein